MDHQMVKLMLLITYRCTPHQRQDEVRELRGAIQQAGFAIGSYFIGNVTSGQRVAKLELSTNQWELEDDGADAFIEDFGWRCSYTDSIFATTRRGEPEPSAIQLLWQGLEHRDRQQKLLIRYVMAETEGQKRASVRSKMKQVEAKQQPRAIEGQTRAAMLTRTGTNSSIGGHGNNDQA